MTFSIIIPTFNEARNIGRLVREIREHGYGSEIIVVDGGSSDQTLEEASRAGAVVWRSPRPGRAAQMNYAARHATGQILYFVHADVKVHPHFINDIQQAIQEGYGAGCYRFRFDSEHPLLRFNSYGTRFEGLMSRGGDQTLFVTRSLFEQLGGFDERYVIMEDFDIIARIRKKARFRVIPKDVIVSARKYESNGWLKVQLANLTAFTLFFLKVSPTRIARAYQLMLTHR